MTYLALAPLCKMLSMFRKSFNSSKCKTLVKLAMSRIKLLRNKKDIQIKQMRRDVAMLIESGQEASARIRVEHVIREQNIAAANDIIELFCELVVARLSIIESKRGCPVDLKEGISSLIFAAPRCADIPELLQIRNIFQKKYGHEFIAAATELRPDCGVNRTLIEKLSTRTASGEAKLRVMKEIAKEYHVQWDTAESEQELLKPPDELLPGPATFVSATSMPFQNSGDNTQANEKTKRISDPKALNRVEEHNSMYFENTASAARAAAESAEKAAAAAKAAAFLANQNLPNDGERFVHSPGSVSQTYSENPNQASRSNNQSETFGGYQSNLNRSHNQTKSIHDRLYASQNYGVSHNLGDDKRSAGFNDANMQRRHSYNGPPSSTNVQSNVVFDDSCSESEEDGDVGDNFSGYDHVSDDTPGHVWHGHPPNRRPPSIPSLCSSDQRMENFGLGTVAPHTHPNLPDCDALTARFEALKAHKKS